MMNWLWAILMIISVVGGAVTGQMGQVSEGVLSGSKQAVELCISLAGMMALWGGLSTIMEQSGLSNRLAKLMSPAIMLLFPELRLHEKARQAISMNVAANMLGLGNAATPLGLAAMKELQKINPHPSKATNSMITFVVLNSVSVQLLPTTVTALRAQYGAQSPMDIIGAVWFSSVLGAAVGLIAVALLNHRRDADEDRC